MKTVGYTTCLTCEGTYRGYKPRGWKPGDELKAWQHGLEDGAMMRCPGSHKVGHQSRLDGLCPPGGHSWMMEMTPKQAAVSFGPRPGQKCLCGAETYQPKDVKP
jgi:hypothetical protein